MVYRLVSTVLLATILTAAAKAPAQAADAPAPLPPPVEKTAAPETVPPPPPPPPLMDTDTAMQLAFSRVMPAMVTVKITVLEDPFGAYEQRSTAETVFDEFIRRRIPLRIAGLRIAPHGEVLVRDPNLPLHRYGSIELQDLDGTVVPARVAAVLANHDALVIVPEKPPAQPQPWAQFAAADIRPGRRFYMAVPGFVEHTLSLEIQPANAAGTLTRDSVARAERLWMRRNLAGRKVTEVIPSAAPVILNRNAEIVGLALDEALWQTPDGRSSWVGTQILADTRITPAQLDAVSEQIREKTTDCIRNVWIEFRPDIQIPQQVPLEQGRLHVFALLLDDKGTLFLPTAFSRDVIGQIDSFTVDDGEHTVKAAFRGIFRTFGGIILSAPGVSGAPITVRQLDELPRGAVFYALSVRRRFGRRYDKIEYTRCLDFQVGYKDQLSPISRKPLRVGDFLVDDEGRFVAFYAPLKPDARDQLHAQVDRGSRQAAVQNRLFRFTEVAAELANPDAHYDPDIRPKSRREEARFVWLGVEYQPLDAPLARMLKVEKDTRDGGRGLLVNHVYEQSPAQSIGIEPGDILLALQLPGTAREFDLAPKGKWRSLYFAPHPVGQRTQRLWRPRRNYLTGVLRYIGEGRTVVFRRIHQGDQNSVSCRLETAPDDFDTATQYKDDTLGLAVKPLTYEVRYALRLPHDAPGVVVNEVEPGGKAALAQITPYEIITTVNDEPVKSPDDFERAMNACAADGHVGLLVTHLGHSRIVEIEFGRDRP